MKIRGNLQTYLSIDLEGTCGFFQVYGGDAVDIPGDGDVGSMSPDGQSHQILADGEFFVKWSRLLQSRRLKTGPNERKYDNASLKI